MPGAELVLGFLMAWAVRRFRHVGSRLEVEADALMDGQLDRLHDLVAQKLEGDTAMKKFEAEAPAGPSRQTQERVQHALTDALQDDPAFADQVRVCLEPLDGQAGQAALQSVRTQWIQGGQFGNYNHQTNYFGGDPARDRPDEGSARVGR